MVVDHALTRLESLPRTAPTHAFHGHLPCEVEILVKSVVVPVRGLGGHVTGLASHALDPRTIRGLVDEGALARIHDAPLLPACGLGRGLRTATGPVEFRSRSQVTVCSLDKCAHVRLAVARSGVAVYGHTGPATGHWTVRPFPLTVCSLGKGVGGLGGVAGIARKLLSPPGITQLGGACTCSGGQLHSPARAIFAGPCQAVPRHVRVLCTAGCGCGVCFWLLVSPVHGPAAQLTSAASFACSRASVPAPGVVSPVGAASTTGSPGGREHAGESPHSERRRRRSSSRERSCSGTKCGKGRSPSPAYAAHSARTSASSLSASLDAGERGSGCLLPLLDVLA